MFRAMFSPIIRSTWLYLQYLVVYIQVAAGWCPECTPDTIIPSRLYMFRAMFSPIIRSSWLYLQYCSIAVSGSVHPSCYRLVFRVHFGHHYSKSALHISGDIFAHHPEHLTVFAVSGSVHPSCCRLVSRVHSGHQAAATLLNTTRYCNTANTVNCSWWWAKTSPETCKADLE